MGLLSAVLCAQTPPADTPPVDTPDEPSTPPPSTEELLGIIGYVMGEGMGLNVGFTEEELEIIFAGMKRAANQEPPVDNFDLIVGDAKKLFFDRKNAFVASLKAKNLEAGEQFFAELDQKEGIQQTESGLRYEIISEGSESKPIMGDTAVITYQGRRINGVVFDSGEAIKFPIRTKGGLIAGFKEAIQLMGVGGEYIFYLPNEIAYGDSAPNGSSIEPGDSLIFQISLLSIEHPTPSAPPVPSGVPGSPPRIPPNMRPPGPPPSTPPTQIPSGPPSTRPAAPPPSLTAPAAETPPKVQD